MINDLTMKSWFVCLFAAKNSNEFVKKPAIAPQKAAAIRMSDVMCCNVSEGMLGSTC